MANFPVLKEYGDVIGIVGVAGSSSVVSFFADDNVSKTALLQNVGLFRGIHEADLTALAQSLVVRRYKAGQLVFKQSDVGSTMYIVFQGQINIYLPAAPDNLPLQMIEAGDHFGELALFDNGPRSASALAMTDVVLLELTQQALTEFILDRPHVALSLLATLSARLRATNSLLSQRAARNAEAEVDNRLTWQDRLADKIAELNGSWAFIIVLIGLIIGWVLLNNGELFNPPFDPYPFVFFNLILAILAALQGPLIVMSQNRQALKDRLQAETDFRVNLKMKSILNAY